MSFANLMGPLYVLTFWLQTILIRPVETELLGPTAELASFVFIPAGVKFLAFYLCGWKAVPSLIICIAGIHFLLYAPADASIMQSFLGACLSACAIPIAHEALKWAGIDLIRRHKWEPPHWLQILVLVFIASFISGLGLTYPWFNPSQDPPSLALLARFAVGDTVGLLVVMLTAMAILRQRRRAQR